MRAMFPTFAFTTVAVWHVTHADTVARVVNAVKRAMGAMDISHKEVAGALGMHKSQWNRMWQSGCNVAATEVCDEKWPGFADELRRQLALSRSRGDERRERLDGVTTQAKKCDLDSSARSSLPPASRQRSA